MAWRSVVFLVPTLQHSGVAWRSSQDRACGQLPVCRANATGWFFLGTKFGLGFIVSVNRTRIARYHSPRPQPARHRRPAQARAAGLRGAAWTYWWGRIGRRRRKADSRARLSWLELQEPNSLSSALLGSSGEFKGWAPLCG